MLARLEERPGDWVALWDLVDDPGDPNEMAKARSEVLGLERRPLVDAAPVTDQRWQVDMTSIFAGARRDWLSSDEAVPSRRARSARSACSATPIDSGKLRWPFQSMNIVLSTLTTIGVRAPGRSAREDRPTLIATRQCGYPHVST